MTSKYCHILHTSDIHLDDKLGEAGEESFAQRGLINVVDKALELEVDLFLLAGDLFDHNRVKQPCLDFATAQLARLHCPVVMITGNHDCMTDYSVYQRYDPCDAGSHIHFIRETDGGIVDFPDLGLKIWGRGIVDHHPENKPLEEVPEKPDSESWYLGMTHGYYIERGGGMYSSLISPDEIEASALDYLALGHVHVFTEIQHGDTHAAYPGSPNVNQGTREMTAAHVEFKPGFGVQINRVVMHETGHVPQSEHASVHVPFTPGV